MVRTVEDTYYISLRKKYRYKYQGYFCHRLPLDHPSVNQRKVKTVSTKCNFGGERNWLVCGICMGKRLELFLINSNYICRECGGLIYEKQRMSRKSILYNKALLDKIHFGEMAESIKRPYYNDKLTKRAIYVLKKLEDSSNAYSKVFPK